MNALNEHLFLWLNLGRQDPAWLMDLARFGSTVWPTAVLVLVLAAIVVGPGRWRLAALHMLLAILLAWLIVRGISTLWPMPRPFVLGLGEQWLAKEPSASFPSSHASIAWAISAAASTTSLGAGSLGGSVRSVTGMPSTRAIVVTLSTEGRL